MCLRGKDQAIPLTPKAFDLLVVLVRQSGQIVEKEELLTEVWPNTFVEEGNLTVHMSALRRALADEAGEAAYIETIPRRGYRFCVPVEVVVSEPRTLVIERLKETRIVREEIEEEIAAPRAIRGRTLVMAACVLLVVGAAAVGWRFAGSIAASPVGPMRAVPFASYPGQLHMPSFAPDGQRIAFPWTGPADNNWDIYVKLLGNDPPLRLTSDPGSDGAPTWSPDGRQIAFIRTTSETTAMYMVGALGGRERRLIDLPYARYFDLEWSPDGKHIAFEARTQSGEPYNSHRFMAIFLLSLDTLEKRQVSFPKDPERDQRFAFSPDGNTLAFLRYDGQDTGIWLVPADGGDARRIYWERAWIGHIVWTADGKSLVFTSAREGGNRLFRIAAEGGSAEPLPITEDQAYFPSIARQGSRMAFLRLGGDVDLWRVELNGTRPAKAPAPFLATARSEFGPEFSPDGQRLAFCSGATGNQEVWVSNADGSNATPVTSFNVANGSTPSWSPDGKELTFSSLRGPQGSPGGIFVVNVETREVRRLSDESYAMPWWSRDGRWVYLAFNSLYGKTGIWKIPAQGGPPVQFSAIDALFVQESPDGSTLYLGRPSGGIWKMPAKGGEARVVIPDLGNEVGVYWRVVNDGIYFVNRYAKPGPAIEFHDFATRQNQRIALLTGEYVSYVPGLTVSADGKWIIYAHKGHDTSEIMLVENFR